MVEVPRQTKFLPQFGLACCPVARAEAAGADPFRRRRAPPAATAATRGKRTAPPLSLGEPASLGAACSGVGDPSGIAAVLA